MKKYIFPFIIFGLLLDTAMAQVSVSILKGKALGDKKAALFVSVVDEAGRPIKGLSKKNFLLRVGGEEITNFKLNPVSITQEPVSVILGIDVSGSMRGEPFRNTKRAVSIFLDQLDKKDFVFLISFGTEVKFLTKDFISMKERYKVREQIDLLRARDKWTHLYDAVYKAIEISKDAPTTRTAIVFITDGRDEGSQNTRERTIAIATGASIPIFTIGFGYKIDKQYLQEIAQVSGGYFLSTSDPERIIELYNKVLSQLKNQYMLIFDFPKEPGPYKANLILSYGNTVAKVSKKFLFNPMEHLKPWYEMQMKYIIVTGLLLIAFLVSGFIYIHKSKEDKEKKKIQRKIECELEFPADAFTVHGYLEPQSKNGKTKLASGALNAFLKVDCLKGQIVPLISHGIEVITELIIARKYEKPGLKQESFRKKEVVYLWTNNPYVSRPKEGKAGHARIVLLDDLKRFAIEDLGSQNGTLINGKNIKNEGTILLNDGDVIDIGGKQGIMIVYRETFEIEKMEEDHEETKIID